MTARTNATLQRLLQNGRAFTMSTQVVTEIFERAADADLSLTVSEFRGGFWIKFAA